MMYGPHYELYGILLFSVLAVLPAAVPLVLGLRVARSRRRNEGRPRIRSVVWSCAFAAAVYAAVAVDAFLVEPNAPELRTIEIPGRLKSELRILHLSDLHIEKEPAAREAWLVETARRVSPDIIFITGDIHQLGNQDAASLRRVLQNLKAPLGVFACPGFDDVSLLEQAHAGLDILNDKTATVRHMGDEIVIAGSPKSVRPELKQRFAAAGCGIVLEHTPDETAGAAEAGADLYLCGHTHGGQVRIPFWGAVITNSKTGKKYEAGLYAGGRMFIHTSRGFGLEPRPAPQVRFFCRPEATLIRIVPQPAPVRRRE